MDSNVKTPNDFSKIPKSLGTQPLRYDYILVKRKCSSTPQISRAQLLILNY